MVEGQEANQLRQMVQDMQERLAQVEKEKEYVISSEVPGPWDEPIKESLSTEWRHTPPHVPLAQGQKKLAEMLLEIRDEIKQIRAAVEKS